MCGRFVVLQNRVGKIEAEVVWIHIEGDQSVIDSDLDVRGLLSIGPSVRRKCEFRTKLGVHTRTEGQ